MRLTRIFHLRRRGDERGAIAIMVALAMVGLLLAGALVLDFGIVRVERQANKLAADSAVTAGLRAGDSGTGQMNPAAAVCGAFDFLRTNNPRLSGLPSPPCTPPPNAVCNPEDPGTWRTYTGTTEFGGTRYEVTIQSPYTFDGSGFPEDDLSTLTSDVGMEDWNGCDQLGVIVRQQTERGLGVFAGNEDLDTRIRSVGRVNLGDGKQAPALLLLDRKNCSVLTVGSAGGGSTSEIKVYGSADQPGTIHADSDASVCANNAYVFEGNKTDGVVAYSSQDGSKAGSLTSVAGFLAKPLSVIRDDPNKVYGYTGKDSDSVGTKSEPTGRSIVTREPVDKRYLEGVRDAVAEANGTAFNQSSFTSPTWKTLTACGSGNGTAVTSLNLTAADRLYVNCSGYNSNVALNAGTIYFNGGNISNANMPNATRVYIKSATADAIRLTNGNTFAVRGGALGTATCSDDAGLGKAAKLVIDSGKITATGGMLRLCNTSVVLMGGRPDACLPAAGFVQPPTAAPCSGGTGTGQVSIAGGASQDWTAPNEHAGAIPEAQQTAAWRGNLEDLALWSESYGGSNNPSYSMAGGSGMHMVGVFMTPNATPFTVTGNGSQDLNNAQYIATSFVVKGGASLQMRVDPNTVVSLPSFDRWTLVR
jgi:Flp pilus assembly protein TadG